MVSKMDILRVVLIAGYIVFWYMSLLYLLFLVARTVWGWPV